MTREEAIKILSERHSSALFSERTALETLIPELKESEDKDERIRKELILHLEELRDWKVDTMVPIKVTYFYDKWIAWLEKEQKATEDWREKQKEPHYTKRSALFDKCVENCDPEVMKEISNKVDEMLGKEQNPQNTKSEIDYADKYSHEVWEKLMSKFKAIEGYQIGANDVSGIVLNAILNAFKWQQEQKSSINMDQLKSMMLQYLQEAANEKDDSAIEADTDKWARKILGYDFEQNPVEGEWPYIDTADTLEGEILNIWQKLAGSSNFLTATKDGFREIILHFKNYIKEEQKPAEDWREKRKKECPFRITDGCKQYAGVISECTGACSWVVDYPKLKEIQNKQEQQSAEWSEEDKAIIGCIVCCLDGQFVTEAARKQCLEWFNKHRRDFLNQPKLEWSEEDEKDMAYIIRILDDCYAYGRHDLSKKYHEKLVNKLKSLKPQSNQEWSEDIIRRGIKEVGLTQYQINWLNSNVFPPKNTDGKSKKD